MKNSGSTFATAAALILALAASPAALAQQPQPQSANPTCQRLEAQLTSLDRGNSDPARAEQIRRTEDTLNRQQFDVDRLVSQSRRLGCESSGFFSIFNTPSPQCGPLQGQIRQARAVLERTQSQLEQMHGGTTERAAQRQSLLIALGNNGCGPQYRQAAVQQGGFLDRLFSPNNTPYFNPPQSDSGTYRTLCVRTCDGYYFPISFAVPQSRFADDERTCQRMCPAAEVSLYSYRNPGEDVNQAVSMSGQPYTALPTAFAYRTHVNAACSCRRPGQSWADALKAGGYDQTLAPGDVVVTEKNSREMALPRDAKGRPIKPELRGSSQPANTPAEGEPAKQQAAQGSAEPPKGKVRTVGPTFYPVR
jgi:hypothetical protein